MVRRLTDPNTQDVLSALEALAADDDVRDGAHGGISPKRVGREFNMGPAAMRKRLRELQSKGKVVKVMGLFPKGKPRQTWLPADHPDARVPPDPDIPRHPGQADD